MNEESDIQQEEVSGAALQLAQAIQELMEEYEPDLPQEVSEQVVRLSNQISQVENKQQQSINHLESIRQLLENTVSANNALAALSTAWRAVVSISQAIFLFALTARISRYVVTPFLL